MRCRRSSHSLGRIASNGDCPSHAHVRRASHLGRTASSIRPDMIFGKDRSCQYMPTPSSTIPWCVWARKRLRARKSPWTFACITSAATRSTLLRSRTWEESRRLAVHFSEVGPVGHQAACFRVFESFCVAKKSPDVLPGLWRRLDATYPRIDAANHASIKDSL